MARRSSDGATTLPGTYYTSSEIFHQETERIFYERWLCAGRASQLSTPGSYFLHQVDDESLILTRDSQGALHAFYNVCRHRGTRICRENSGEFAGRIQCPYHGWTYALDGSLIGAPNMQSVWNFDRSEYPLREAGVREWAGFLFINLSETPQPFEESFAPLIGRLDSWRLSELQVAGRIVYDVQANWKLLFQNYSECYHCPKVHPVLAKLTPYQSSTNHFEAGAVLGGRMEISVQGGSMTIDGRACAAPLPEETEHLNSVYYYTVFPTMFLSLHPDYVLVHRLEPQSPKRTQIICEWLFHPDAMKASDFDPAPAIEFWDLTNRQDWNVCELSQLGVRSRAYTPGPYADLESLLAAFDSEYLLAMEKLTARTAETAQ